ncbi:50S ribosomal protein L3 [Candidatus Woesearchaeota archaeon]|nr:50S ribosomal protein L3 [Candidatus Woesearchaeota archaeon]
MPDAHHPHRGSLQYWPRKRSKHLLVRVRSWIANSKAKPLGFIAYKAGMTHVMAIENRPKALSKGELISLPVTVLDCPPLVLAGVSFYKHTKKVSSFFASPKKELARRIQPAKKEQKSSFEKLPDFDDLRLIVQTQPQHAGVGKIPQLLEIALGGKKEEKLAYVKEKMGKEIALQEVFETGSIVDVHGISTGKGFQGTVKRFGVPIRQHKAEKTKRGIATLGSWTPEFVQYSVAQSGKMGYHLRTEYNKQIFKIGQGNEITPEGGMHKYGVLKNSYAFIKGSVVGPKKRAVVLTQGMRIPVKLTKEAPEIRATALRP